MSDESGSLDSETRSSSTLERARSALRTHWGYEGFRDGQAESIAAVMEGRDVLTILPTGGGKSLCYQVPAVAQEGTVLVVSPLISLMQDQVASLRARGVSASFLSSHLSRRQIDQRLTNTEYGQYDLLYVSPERLQSDLFRGRLDRLPIALLAVDEAHCVSEWGHDFRPAYLEIGTLREELEETPMLACTATATPPVRRDVIEQLGLRDPARVIRGFDRPNLRWTVLYPDDRFAEADRLLQRIDGSAIVYGSTRRQVERQAGRRKDAEPYHAGLSGSKRTEIQEAWMSGALRVVAATNAFGMGVDKSDVRLVAHASMPGSVEAYYQEAGRAGRDGEPAHAVLLYRVGDEELREHFIASSHPDPAQIQAVYRAVGDLGQVPMGATPEEPVPAPVDRIADLVGESPSLVRTAIELLERAGAWRRVRPRPHHALIRLSQPVETIRTYAAGLENEALAEFVRTLLRTVYADAASQWYELDLRLLERRSDLPRARVERGLDYLAGRDLLAWHGPDRSDVRVQFLEARSRSFPVDTAPIAQARDRSLRSLDHLLRYVWHPGCRRRFLLAYFGQEASERCGRCDFCLGRHRPDALDEMQQQRAQDLLAAVRDGDGVLEHWRGAPSASGPSEEGAGSSRETAAEGRLACFRVLSYLVAEGLLRLTDPVDQRLVWTETARSRPHPWVPETADGR